MITEDIARTQDVWPLADCVVFGQIVFQCGNGFLRVGLKHYWAKDVRFQLAINDFIRIQIQIQMR